MSFERPTINEILDRVKGDLRTELDLKAILRRTFLFSLATAVSGASHELHGRASYIAKQLFVDQMDNGFLDRFGAIYKVPRNEATFAQFNVLFTGTAGTVIPVGTSLTRNDGETYETNAEVTIETGVTGVAEEFDCDTVADLSGSLNSTYFEFSTPDNEYYVWIDVDNGGTDPSITDKTGVEVEIARNDNADTVASAIQSAVNLLTDVNATVSTNTVTITNINTGSVSDPTDGAQPTGFTLTVTTQGVDEVIGDQVQGTVTADNSGSAQNTDAGEFLSLTSAITDVDSDVEVQDAVIEGEDVETDENYRQRLLDRLRQPPHGGNVNDYVQWAKEVSGVTRAWVTKEPDGAGSVLVSFVEDGEDDIFPSQAKKDEVQEYINDLAPVTARVIVDGPVDTPLDLTIKIKPNTSTVRSNVEQELRDLIYRDSAPKNAIKDASKNELYDGTILLSRIREAISTATGEEDNEVVSPTTNFEVGDGEMASLGTITWQAL